MSSSPESTPAAPKQHVGGRNLPAAIAFSVVAIGYIVVTLRWWQWGFVLLVAACLVLGSYEVLRALRTHGLKPVSWPVLVGAPLVVCASYLAAERSNGIDAAVHVQLAGLIVIVLVSMGWRLRGGTSGYIGDLGATLLTACYPLLLGGPVILMLADTQPAARIIVFLLCVFANDTGAYAFGSWFGKHKMVPKLSPAKTWEGFVGGLVIATGGCIWLSVWILDATWWAGAIIGVAIGLCATIGDLVESAIKRDVGIKDMGTAFPGQGGAMDRLDSILYCAPVVWALMYFLVP